jgi:hypothetical protein
MSAATVELKPCPTSGDGVHSWLFYAACQFVEAGVGNEVAEQQIESLMTRPPNPTSEIRDALQSARGERSGSAIVWPPINEEQVDAIARDGMPVKDLCARSPMDMRFGQNRVDAFIDLLFPANPWLCVGSTTQRFATKRREEWRGRLHNCALIVPSPMTAEVGTTKQGRQSFHALDNTGPRKYLVIEADRGGLDQQSAVLVHLGMFAPLAAVVFSGSKSLHGWFPCASKPEDTLLRFMHYAVSLGADRKMWLRSQFARIPDGHRADGKWSDALSEAGLKGTPRGQQTVVYFNPEVLK